MKSRNIYVSNSKITEEHEMSIKQSEYLRHLFKSKSIDNPFTSYQDMRNRLSKFEARKAIDLLVKDGQIIWITPPKE